MTGTSAVRQARARFAADRKGIRGSNASRSTATGKRMTRRGFGNMKGMGGTDE